MSRILITGSSKGLGESLAQIFAENKYDVILHGRDEESLAHVKSKVLNHNVDCDVVVGDLVEKDTIRKIQIISEKKGIDVLINNAGIYLNKPFLETSMEEFRKVIETNFMAVVSLTYALFPIMQSKGSGLIININSLAGKNGSDGEAAYCASKHALRGFSSSLQFDATKYGIRIIDVYLGAMQTRMTEKRENHDRLIKPDQASEMIINICENYDSLRATEIDLMRANY